MPSTKFYQWLFMTELFLLTCSWLTLLDLFLGLVFQSFDFNATTGIALVDDWEIYKLRGSVGFGVVHPQAQPPASPLYLDIPF